MTNSSPKVENKELSFGEFVLNAILFSIPSVLAGILFFLYQCLGYLQTGVWTPHSFIELLVWLNNNGYQNIPWAVKPDSWFGLYNLLVQLPLSAGLIIFAPLIGYLSFLAIGFLVIGALLVSIPSLLFDDRSPWWCWLVAASEILFALWFVYSWLIKRLSLGRSDSPS